MRVSDRLRRTHRPACEPLERRRLLSAGDLDPSFSGDGRLLLEFPGAPFEVHDVSVQADRKIVVVGVKGGSAAVARLAPDGTVDSSFGQGGLFLFGQGTNGMTLAAGVALQGDGKIVVAGANFYAFETQLTVGRLLANGARDASFGDNGVVHTRVGDDSSAADVAIQQDGKIVAAGKNFGGGLFDEDDFAVVRYNPDGLRDNTFDGDGITTIGFGGAERASAVAIDYNGTAQTNPYYGTIVAVGGDSRFLVARLLPNGEFDDRLDTDGKVGTNFPGGVDASATSVVIQSGGRIVAAGFVGPSGGSTHNFALARYTPAGALDSSFGADGTGRVETDLGGDDQAYGMAVGDLGGLMVAGVSFLNLAVAAYTPSGRLDTRFGGDGKVVTTSFGGEGGAWTSIANAPGRRLVVAGGTGRLAAYIDIVPVVALVSLDTVATEEGQGTAAFFVTLDQASPSPLRVHLTVGGTATPASRATRTPDYTGFTPADPLLGGGYVEIPAGQTFATVVITPVDDALVEGDETAVFTVKPNEDYDPGANSSVTLTIRDNEPPPVVRVTQVFVNAPGLTGQTSANGVAFRAVAGIDNTYGYPVPAGTNQLKSIPWFNGVNQVALRFDTDVASTLQRSDLAVRGVITGSYPASGFAYDAATKTGVWTLSTPITSDKVRVFLDDALLAALDGEWADGSAAESYPSGNGTPGGDFSFRINVLRGDATQDGAVNALDLSFIKQRLNKTATNPGTTGATYSPFADLTVDGSINALDLSAAKQRLNTRLPDANPTATGLLRGE